MPRTKAVRTSDGDIAYSDLVPPLNNHDRTGLPPEQLSLVDDISSAPVSNTLDEDRSAVSAPARPRTSQDQLLAYLKQNSSSNIGVADPQLVSSASTSSHAVRSPNHDSIPLYGARDTQPTSSVEAAPLTVKEQMILCRRLQQTVTSMRDAILETRFKLDMEQKKSDDCRRFVHESLTKLTEAQSEAMNAEALESSFEVITTLRTNFEKDIENLQNQDVTTKEVQSDLISQEFNLMAEEGSLVNSLAALCSTLGFNINEAPSEPDASTEPPDVPREPQHPLALEFYNRKGKVQILRERLDEVDYEHREEQEKRSVRDDQRQLGSEGEFEETESELRRRFEVKRQDILTEMMTVEQEMYRLEKECVESGVELEREPASSVGVESAHEVDPVIDEQPKVTYVVPARPSRFLPTNVAAESTLLTARLQSETVDERFKSRPTQDRRHIRQWLDDVASMPDYVMPETELGLEEPNSQKGEVLTGEDPSFIPQDHNQDSNHENLKQRPLNPRAQEEQHHQERSPILGSAEIAIVEPRWEDGDISVDPLGLDTEEEPS